MSLTDTWPNCPWACYFWSSQDFSSPDLSGPELINQLPKSEDNSALVLEYSPVSGSFSSAFPFAYDLESPPDLLFCEDDCAENEKTGTNFSFSWGYLSQLHHQYTPLPVGGSGGKITAPLCFHKYL